LWNIGEALGVLYQKRRRGWLTEKEFEQTLNLFAEELVKFMRLKAIEIIPVQAPILTNTWNLILSHHVYEAYALQITTCSYNNDDALVTNDKKLAQTGRKIGIKTVNLPKDELDLKNLMH